MGALYPPRDMAELAIFVAASGWDGIFLEESIVYRAAVGTPTYDLGVVLSAIAVATKHLRLGTMVTPLPLRHP